MSKKGLLISVQGIGNAVLLTPALRSLAERGFRIDMILSDNGSDQLLGASKFVNKQYLWRERDGWLHNVIRLGIELLQEKYDIAYALFPNGKRENVLLFLTRATHKKSYVDKEHYYRLFHFLAPSVKRGPEKDHDVISNLHLVGVDGAEYSRYKPGLSISPENQSFAGEFFERRTLGDKFVFAICPGGGGAAKQWTPENYADLCRRLVQLPNTKALILGSKSEQELVQRVCGESGDGVYPLYDVDIGRASALLQRSQLFVGNDSALMHIAASFEVPVIAIWGYTDFYRTAPYSRTALLIRIDYPCNPCYLFANGYIDDCQYHLKCIRDISVEQVYRSVEKYAHALMKGESLDLDSFVNESSLESVTRLESGCLMVTLKV